MKQRCFDDRGAVYVEFIIAFAPLFVMFMGLCQLAGLYSGKLVCLHAAEMAVRASVVVLSDDPQFDRSPAAVERAAKLAAKGSGGLQGVSVDVTPSAPGRNDIVKVKVKAQYQCMIPVGRLVVCGGGTQMLTGEASMINQGVDFEYSGYE
jgi:Flp pilus assembly protein TadG